MAQDGNGMYGMEWDPLMKMKKVHGSMASLLHCTFKF